MSEGRTERAQARLQQGTYSASGEVLDYTFFDSQALLSTILRHRFFVQGLGKPMTTGVIKNLSHSNIISEGMPQSQKFTIKAIKCFYKPKELRNNAEMQNIVDVLTKTVVTFRINGKDVILQMTLQELCGDNFPVIHVPTVAGDNINTHQLSLIRSAYPLNVPIVLSALTHYEMEMEHTAAPAADLDGDMIQLSIQGALERLA